jgi:hypothetical protein
MNPVSLGPQNSPQQPTTILALLGSRRLSGKSRWADRTQACDFIIG